MMTKHPNPVACVGARTRLGIFFTIDLVIGPCFEYFAVRNGAMALFPMANSHALNTLPITPFRSRLWRGIVAKLMILIEAQTGV